MILLNLYISGTPVKRPEKHDRGYNCSLGGEFLLIHLRFGYIIFSIAYRVFFSNSHITELFHDVQFQSRKIHIILSRYTELKCNVFSISSKLYTVFYHQMSNKCHDRNSGDRKNHNEILMIQY